MKWRTLNINGFAEVGSDLVRYNLLSSPTVYFIIDPTIINSFGGTKTSTLTKTQIESMIYSSSDNVTVPNKVNFYRTTWGDNGWTSSDSAVLLQELKTWCVNNISAVTGVNLFFDVTIIFIYDSLNSTDYVVPIIYYADSFGSSAATEVPASRPNAPIVSSNVVLTNNKKPTWSWVSGGGGNGTYRYRLDNPDLSGSSETLCLWWQENNGGN